MNEKLYKLVNSNGETYYSEVKGLFGGNKSLKIYGRLDCPSALRWIQKGYYVDNRVFFANEEDAINAGYRPCGVCMKKEYEIWKSNNVLTLKKKR
jgi:methylphosphotriester-DNA--protein-cysteine methyltransferase